MVNRFKGVFQMPYQVTTIADTDSVILVTYTGEMTAHDVSESIAELVDLATPMARPVYQIGDFRQATGTFASVLRITHTFPNMMRVYADEQIIGPIVVNSFNNKWLQLSLNLLNKMKIERFITFEEIDEALNFVRDKQSLIEANHA